MKGEMRIGKNHTAGRNPAKLQESKADLTPSDFATFLNLILLVAMLQLLQRATVYIRLVNSNSQEIL
jgi:hypothetical protein